MPCTRSMVRSVSTKGRGDEMPPPVVASPPPKKTRSTRSKNVSSKQKTEERQVTKSPTPPASSTRSTRANKNTRSKAQAEAVVVEHVPPSTRSTRQKAVVGAKKQVKQENEKQDDNVSTALPQEFQPIEKKASKKKQVEAASSIVAKTGEAKRPRNPRKVESQSEDLSTEDEIEPAVPQHKRRALPLEQLHKQHVIPLKTALDLSVCEVFPRCMKKIMDPESTEKMEKTYQLLINSTEMPPPPPPVKTKGKKGRKKRARSPDTAVEPSNTNVPSSFNFAENKDDAPAKKKLILDGPPATSGSEATEEIDENKLAVERAKSQGETTRCPSQEKVNEISDSMGTQILPQHVFENEKDQSNSDDQKSSIPNKESSPNKGVALDATYIFDTPKDDNVETQANATYTPELFVVETPKSSRGQEPLNQTVVISKKDNFTEEAYEILAPPSPEPAEPAKIENGNGIVSSLVNFFDNKKEVNKATTHASDSKGDKNELMRSISPDFGGPQNPNETYCIPQKNTSSKGNPSSLLNMTVCLNKKGSNDEVTTTKCDSLIPILPPSQLNENQPRVQGKQQELDIELVASRTFVKESSSLAVVLEEEEVKDPILSNKSEKVHTVIKSLHKEPKKGVSSSSNSSSSGSSMKSAVSQSQPCLISKKLGTNSSKNGPSYGSAGKLNEIQKSKPLEDVEKRRQEILKQKTESHKKKMDEWKKKTEKIKLEEEKKQKEKLKQVSSNTVLKKPILPSKGILDVPSCSGTVFTKPKVQCGVPGIRFPISGASNLPPPLSKQPYHKPLAPGTNDYDADDSFKTASNSFLDATMDGHLSSYDITVYEDLDEDLKHRENKTVPKWASDKEALKEALFSMVLLSDYQFKLPSTFPKPDKNYKLFPNKIVHH